MIYTNVQALLEYYNNKLKVYKKRMQVLEKIVFSSNEFFSTHLSFWG